MCVPRKDPDYVPPNKVVKNSRKSPQNVVLQIPSVEGRHSKCAVSTRPKPVIVPA